MREPAREAIALGGAARAGRARVSDDVDDLIALALGEGAPRALLVLQAVAVLGLLVGGDAAVAERLLGNGRMCVGFGLAPGLEVRHAPGAA